VSSRDLPSQSIATYLSAIGSDAPTPGGGSAACVAGALAAALGRMVLAVAQARESTQQRSALLRRLSDVEAEFLRLAADDEAAFSRVTEAYRLPKAAPDRSGRLEEALRRAACVPLQGCELAVALLDELAEVAPHAGPSIVSDVGVAAHLALASLRSSVLNVRVNVVAMRNPETKAELSTREVDLANAGEASHERLSRIVSDRISRQ
jgi:formiminotetrahydrofolate cyclodeaminase